jgi:hypothetical protein
VSFLQHRTPIFALLNRIKRTRDGISLDLARGGENLPGFQSLLRRSVDELMGCSMKNAMTALHLPSEQFVVQVDGQQMSQHRRFVDALIAGLLLRNELPQHEVKVLEAGTNAQDVDVIH